MYKVIITIINSLNTYKFVKLELQCQNSTFRAANVDIIR